jgi:hypothetical protein
VEAAPGSFMCFLFSTQHIGPHVYSEAVAGFSGPSSLLLNIYINIITMKGWSFRVMRFALSSTLSIPWLALLLLAFGRLQVPTFVVDNSGIHL